MENSFVIMTPTANRKGETYFRGTLSQIGNPHTSVDLNDAECFPSARAAYEFASATLPRPFHGAFRVGRRPVPIKFGVPTAATQKAVREARQRVFDKLMASFTPSQETT